MKDEFHKVDDGTTLWSNDGKYYDNNCYPNVTLIRDGNYLRDEDSNKVYEIVEDNFKHVEGTPLTLSISKNNKFLYMF